MHHPLPELLETFPGFRDAYDKYCLAPWSCYRAIQHELLPRMMKDHSESGMTDGFKTGVRALADCMKFATAAAQRADEEHSIDQHCTLQHGIIIRNNSSLEYSTPLITVLPIATQLSYEEFDVSYSYSVPFRRMNEGWQEAEQGFMREWRRYQQGQSTVAQLLHSILSEVNMRTVAPGPRHPIEQAINGAWKRDWLAHICSSNSATHRACSTVLEDDGQRALFRQLVLLSINVQNYEENLRTCPSSHCLFPSDNLICSAIGHAKCAIYTHHDLDDSFFEPVRRLLAVQNGCELDSPFALAGTARSRLSSSSHAALARQPARP